MARIRRHRRLAICVLAVTVAACTRSAEPVPDLPSDREAAVALINMAIDEEQHRPDDAAVDVYSQEPTGTPFELDRHQPLPPGHTRAHSIHPALTSPTSTDPHPIVQGAARARGCRR